jgi:predicted O-methyltransferase YrrM
MAANIPTLPLHAWEISSAKEQSYRGDQMQALKEYFTMLENFDHVGNSVAIDRCHNMFMMGALLAKKPDDILELGLGSGYVTISLIHGVRYNGKGKLTCVDNWADARGASMEDLAADLRKLGVNVVAPVEEYRFVSGCPSDAYDFLISDADHVNSGTWVDEHLRIVRSGGFLFFHDTNMLSEYPNMALITSRVKELNLCHYHFKESSRPDEQCERGWLFVMKP